MTRSLLLGAVLLSHSLWGQTTLFEDNFETVNNNWTLNVSATGGNGWAINNAYEGMAPLVPNTPAQPGGTTGGVNSYYMHIMNLDYCDQFALCNAGFESASASTTYAQLTNAIDASGMGNVTISFIYLCAGQSGSTYGTLEYSLDNTTWNSAATYSGVSTWTTATVSLPAWSNAATLKFRFKWQNTSAGADPAFAVDEVTVTGQSGSFANIATGSINPTSWCAQSQAAITVPFTVTGTINPGNVYTAQISNASGSFASPVNIGSLTSSATGSLNINANLPGGTTPGTGYRIRVVASDPATTGSDNGSNLTVHALPSITILSNPSDGIMCPGESVVMLASGGTSFSWSPPTGLSATTGSSTTATPSTTTTYTVSGTDQNGCTGMNSATVTVDDCANIADQETTAFTVYPNPTTGEVSIVSTNGQQVNSVSIFDVAGKQLGSLAVNGQSFSLANFPSGVYWIRFNNETSVTRVIKW